MTTEYRVRLDRTACDGVFACLVRDGRFAEAEDGLATVAGGDPDGDGVLVATFDDDRLDDARGAAGACPVDAIDVREVADE
ncbi:MAG: ferredoxin [Haloferacaceae archaeon]